MNKSVNKSVNQNGNGNGNGKDHRTATPKRKGKEAVDEPCFPPSSALPARILNSVHLSPLRQRQRQRQCQCYRRLHYSQIHPSRPGGKQGERDMEMEEIRRGRDIGYDDDDDDDDDQK